MGISPTIERCAVLTPLKAIRAKCIDCCCGQLAEVRACPVLNCPLYPYRDGHNPSRKGIGGFKQNEEDLETEEIVHPYYFGDPVRKATCLWLKGLPPLQKTNVVEPNIIKDRNTSYSGPAYYAKDENGKILSWNDPRTAKARSKTYHGFALAMAEQWG